MKECLHKKKNQKQIQRERERVEKYSFSRWIEEQTKKGKREILYDSSYVRQEKKIKCFSDSKKKNIYTQEQPQMKSWEIWNFVFTINHFSILNIRIDEIARACVCQEIIWTFLMVSGRMKNTQFFDWLHFKQQGARSITMSNMIVLYQNKYWKIETAARHDSEIKDLQLMQLSHNLMIEIKGK